MEPTRTTRKISTFRILAMSSNDSLVPLPWWKCEFPNCTATFNTNFLQACHQCNTPLAQMPLARQRFPALQAPQISPERQSFSLGLEPVSAPLRIEPATRPFQQAPALPRLMSGQPPPEPDMPMQVDPARRESNLMEVFDRHRTDGTRARRSASHLFSARRHRQSVPRTNVTPLHPRY